MATLLEYKCPCCNGKLEFDSTLQQMKCPYCDNTIEVEALKELDAELSAEQPDSMPWQTDAGGEWGAGEADGLKVYVCESCGGEIAADETTGASTCPYCDSPVVMKGNFAGSLRPDCLIPFKLSKEQAVAALNEHLKGKKLLPKVFKQQNHIEEIKALYVPFWLFDAKATASMRYKGEKIRTWSSGNKSYTETSHFALIRKGSIKFETVPVDGSTKVDNDLMESIEPFDFRQAQDFQTAYLSGYLADKYDVSDEQCVERANERIRYSTEQKFEETTRDFVGVTKQSGSIQLSEGKTRYALCPVWLLTTKWNGETFTFAMNGQTGKFVGNLPTDKGIFWKYFFGIGAVTAVLAYAVMFLIHLL